MALRRTDRHPAGHPLDCSVVRSPCSRGPIWRASCARNGRSKLQVPAPNKAMDGRTTKRPTRRCMPPS